MAQFEWTARKAQRNVRRHKVPFTLAQRALESGLGVPIGEQFEEDEWRTLVVAPLPNGIPLLLVITHRVGDEDENSIQSEGANRTEIAWQREDLVVRIISARKASKCEEELYFADRSPEGR